MNYEQVNSIKKLAPKVNKVLEGLNIRGCSDCANTGWIIRQIKGNDTRKEDGRICPTCNGTGKTHYSWTPQVGEWCTKEDSLYLVTGYWINKVTGNLSLLVHVNGYEIIELQGRNCIPILEWEEIERVLEKAGYILSIRDDINPETVSKNGFQCTIEKGFDFPIFSGYGKIRQSAVMKAVLELGKEINNGMGNG